MASAWLLRTHSAPLSYSSNNLAQAEVSLSSPLSLSFMMRSCVASSLREISEETMEAD